MNAISRPDLRGLRVVSFESRRAKEMAELIRRYGGNPLLAPSMREIPLGENRAAFRATHDAELLDRLALKLRTGGSACEVSQYLACFWRAALCEDEHRLRSQFR